MVKIVWNHDTPIGNKIMKWSTQKLSASQSFKAACQGGQIIDLKEEENLIGCHVVLKLMNEKKKKSMPCRIELNEWKNNRQIL